jgi:hypothetical protein
MKVYTEWRVGVLAFIFNVLACVAALFTMLIGFEVGVIRFDLVWWFSAIYLVSLVLLFYLWVDKFNYIED